MSKIPCFDQKKSSLNMLQLTQLAKDLNIDVPAKMSKRDLCVKLNSLQSAEQAKIIDEKLKLLKGETMVGVASEIIPVETSELAPVQPQNTDLAKLTGTPSLSDAANRMNTAIKSNDVNLLRNMFDREQLHIDEKINLDGNQTRIGLLKSVIAFGSFEMFRFLIEKGIQIFKTDGELVYEATYYEQTDILIYLLERGVETTYRDPKNKEMSAVFLAVRKKGHDSVNILSLLIKYGADINLVVAKYVTPLYVAVLYNNVQAVKLLLENCAVVTDRVFGAVLSRKNFEIGELLSKHEESKKCLKRGAPTTVVESIKFPAGEVSAIDESDVSFLGTEINRMVALSYFLQRYKHVCVSDISDLEWRCSIGTSSCIKTAKDIAAKIQRCQQNPSVRFIIGIISLQAPGRGHANAYVIDTKDVDTSGNNIVTAEIFEPHGSVDETFYQHEQYKLAVRKLFIDDLKVNRLFFSDEFCPAVGLQRWQQAEKEPTKKFDPLGFCAAWAMWWIHYRLENSTFPRDVLAHQATIHFLKQSKDISITNFIRNYAFSIATHRKVMIETLCKSLVANFSDYEKRQNRMAQLKEANEDLRPFIESGKATQSQYSQIQQNERELRELGNHEKNDLWIEKTVARLIFYQFSTDISERQRKL